MTIRIALLALLFTACGAGRSFTTTKLTANTINAASCSYADVQAAVDSAVAGDTVVVPAGSCTWNTQLLITTGIKLQGAGTNSTTVTSDVGLSTYLIKYQPTNPALNEPFVLTGFTIDLNRNSPGVHIENNTMNAINKIRIHNNNFLNCTSGRYPVFFIQGTVYGVADHNTFTGTPHFDTYGNNENSWNNLTFTYGSADNFYYEDNVITGDDGFHTGGHGGRYVARYNTYKYSNNKGLLPWFDVHGNQPSGVYATMGAEFYGNIVHASTNGHVVKFLHHRGGKVLFFFNKVVSSDSRPTFQSQEEWSDSIDPTTNPQPQHVSDSYYWNNRFNTSLVNSVAVNGRSDAPYPEYEISENVDFYNYNPSFDGATGMGCGALASRPATCTPGVGYWATNQSCSAIDGDSIGVNPKKPISGTLYKCTSPNTWTAYYTPYTYPHPLTLSLSSNPTSPPSR